MKIICKTTLLAAEVPGTRIEIATTEASPKFGCFLLQLAEGRESGVIDWGDGTSEAVTPDRFRLTHVYAQPGTHVIAISDDIGEMEISAHIKNEYCTTYAPLIRRIEVVSELVRLHMGVLRGATALRSVDLAHCACPTLPNRAFVGCTALERIELPHIERIDAPSADGLNVFSDCTSLREIVFSAAHEASVKASDGYLADPALGAPSAQVIFA